MFFTEKGQGETEIGATVPIVFLKCICLCESCGVQVVGYDIFHLLVLPKCRSGQNGQGRAMPKPGVSS